MGDGVEALGVEFGSSGGGGVGALGLPVGVGALGVVFGSSGGGVGSFLGGVSVPVGEEGSFDGVDAPVGGGVGALGEALGGGVGSLAGDLRDGVGSRLPWWCLGRRCGLPCR